MGDQKGTLVDRFIRLQCLKEISKLDSHSNLRVINSLDQESWRQFVNQHPQGNVFHTPEMFQVFARAKGHWPTVWATLDEHDHPSALLLPVQIELKGVWLRWLTTRAVVYGGALCAPGPKGQAALKLLLTTYKRAANGSALFTELRNLADLSEQQSTLNKCAFAFQGHLNYLIDLHRPAEEILQNITPRTRKQIRRGLRGGEVKIEEITTREQLEVCYDLLARTYMLAQVPLADLSLFKAAFDVLHPKGMIKFIVAKIQNTYVGTSIELLYKDIVYGWYSGLDREYSRCTPGELIMWHILQWSAENGYRLYDFGGAGKPDEEYGVRDFKAKFGGQLVNYGRNICVHSPFLLRLSMLGYPVYRQLLRRRI